MNITKGIIVLAPMLVTLSCAEPEINQTIDAQSIRAANQHYISLHPQGDVDELMKLYVDDAVLLPPGETPVVGSAGIRSLWEGFFADWTVVDAESVIDEAIVFGEWAYARGHFVETYRSNTDGSTFIEQGNFSGLWQRQSDGNWKIARDMWNVKGASE